MSLSIASPTASQSDTESVAHRTTWYPSFFTGPTVELSTVCGGMGRLHSRLSHKPPAAHPRPCMPAPMQAHGMGARNLVLLP